MIGEESSKIADKCMEYDKVYILKKVFIGLIAVGILYYLYKTVIIPKNQ